MTEKEWLACEDSLPMLQHLGSKASGRKLRLFAVACCRGLLHLLSDERNRLAIEVAERYADKQAKRVELRKAEQESREAAHLAYRLRGDNYAALAATEAAAYTAYKAAYETSYLSQTVKRYELDLPGGGWVQASSSHAHLIRDIFGNPFRPITLDASWITWDRGTVRKIAQAIYHERAFDRLPVLADALEEAGCNNLEILTHCRQQQDHIRGCWVVDLILGKE